MYLYINDSNGKWVRVFASQAEDWVFESVATLFVKTDSDSSIANAQR